jgi:hypothetical protein
MKRYITERSGRVGTAHTSRDGREVDFRPLVYDPFAWRTLYDNNSISDAYGVSFPLVWTEVMRWTSGQTVTIVEAATWPGVPAELRRVRNEYVQPTAEEVKLEQERRHAAYVAQQEEKREQERRAEAMLADPDKLRASLHLTHRDRGRARRLRGRLEFGIELCRRIGLPEKYWERILSVVEAKAPSS